MTQISIAKTNLQLADEHVRHSRMEVVNAQILLDSAQNMLAIAATLGSPDLVGLCEKLVSESRTMIERWIEVRNEFLETAIHWGRQLEICQMKMSR